MKLDIIGITCNVDLEIDSLQKKLCGTLNDSSDQLSVFQLLHLVFTSSDIANSKKNTIILNSKCIHYQIDSFMLSTSIQHRSLGLRLQDTSIKSKLVSETIEDVLQSNKTTKFLNSLINEKSIYEAEVVGSMINHIFKINSNNTEFWIKNSKNILSIIKSFKAKAEIDSELFNKLVLSIFEKCLIQSQIYSEIDEILSQLLESNYSDDVSKCINDLTKKLYLEYSIILLPCESISMIYQLYLEKEIDYDKIEVYNSILNYFSTLTDKNPSLVKSIICKPGKFKTLCKILDIIKAGLSDETLTFSLKNLIVNFQNLFSKLFSFIEIRKLKDVKHFGDQFMLFISNLEDNPKLIISENTEVYIYILKLLSMFELSEFMNIFQIQCSKIDEFISSELILQTRSKNKMTVSILNQSISAMNFESIERSEAFITAQTFFEKFMKGHINNFPKLAKIMKKSGNLSLNQTYIRKSILNHVDMTASQNMKNKEEISCKDIFLNAAFGKSHNVSYLTINPIPLINYKNTLEKNNVDDTLIQPKKSRLDDTLLNMNTSVNMCKVDTEKDSVIDNKDFINTELLKTEENEINNKETLTNRRMSEKQTYKRGIIRKSPTLSNKAPTSSSDRKNYLSLTRRASIVRSSRNDADLNRSVSKFINEKVSVSREKLNKTISDKKSSLTPKKLEKISDNVRIKNGRETLKESLERLSKIDKKNTSQGQIPPEKDTLHDTKQTNQQKKTLSSQIENSLKTTTKNLVNDQDIHENKYDFSQKGSDSQIDLKKSRLSARSNSRIVIDSKINKKGDENLKEYSGNIKIKKDSNLITMTEGNEPEGNYKRNNLDVSINDIKHVKDTFGYSATPSERELIQNNMGNIFDKAEGQFKEDIMNSPNEKEPIPENVFDKVEAQFREKNESLHESRNNLYDSNLPNHNPLDTRYNNMYNNEFRDFNMTMPNNLYSMTNKKNEALQEDIDEVHSKHLKNNQKLRNTRSVNNYLINDKQKNLNRTVFSPSFMNTTMSEDLYSSVSVEQRRKVTSVLPATPELPFTTVENVMPKISDKMLQAGLSSKNDKNSKLIRQYCNIGMIEAVSIVKETGCKNFDELYKWADKLLVTHGVVYIIQELQSCIISWKRSSVFCSVLFLLLEKDGVDIRSELKDCNLKII